MNSKPPNFKIETKFNLDTFLGIPYSPDFSDGRTCAGFIDLVKQPTRASDIVEVQDFPAMREFLETVNDSTSQFFTIGCEKFFNAFEQPNEHGVTRYCRGYLEIGFRSLPLNSKYESFTSLISRFESDCIELGWPAFIYAPEFELQRAIYKEQNVMGFACAFWFCSLGADDTQCRERGRIAIERFSKFLMNLSPEDSLFCT